jgi:hypothetical protein
MKNFILIIFIFFGLNAQDLIFPSTMSSTYRLGKNDELIMNINLWGHVLKPGAYEIPINYSLVELISHAGGPGQSANLDDVKIVRKDNEIVRVNIKQYIQTGDFSNIPQLKPGDTVIVGGSLRNVFGEIIGYLRDLAIVLNVIVLTQRLN